MAIQSFQLDPEHQHIYKRLDKIGCDADYGNGSPRHAWITYDGEPIVVKDGERWLRYIGVRGLEDYTEPSG